jgi:hypothetical protein
MLVAPACPAASSEMKEMTCSTFEVAFKDTLFDFPDLREAWFASGMRARSGVRSRGFGTRD